MYKGNNKMEVNNDYTQELVRCPFNPNHKIRSLRLIYHMLKCPNKPADYETCRYNFTHALKAGELEAHEATCSDRFRFPEVLPIDYKKFAVTITEIGYKSEFGVLEEEDL